VKKKNYLENSLAAKYNLIAITINFVITNSTNSNSKKPTNFNKAINSKKHEYSNSEKD
jgi:hypothetical protein